MRKATDQALQHAVAALYSDASLSGLSIKEKAVLLSLTTCLPNNTVPSDKLAHSLLGYSNIQVSNCSLRELALVLHAIVQHDKTLLQGSFMARVTKRLLEAEIAFGGPYKEIDGSVDYTAQLYLASVLRQFGVRPLGLQRIVARAQQMYCQQPHVLGWFDIYSLYNATDDSSLRTALSHYFASRPGRSLTKAIRLYSLPNEPSEAHIRIVLQTQTADGKWLEGTNWTLPTAFIAHALHAANITAAHSPHKHDHTRTAVAALTEQYITTIPDLLKVLLTQQVNKLYKADTHHEITLLPTYFYDSLHKQPRQADHLLSQLGAANVFYWLAYTTYDDFIDNEGEAQGISVANVAMRRSLTAYGSALPDTPTFVRYVHRVFDRIDYANAWEVAHCRATVSGGYITIAHLPLFREGYILAERASAHILGPLALLCATDLTPRSHTFAAVRKAFDHYLIAKQLNDDVHDWQEDLQAGNLTFVVSDMLRHANIAPGRYELTTLLAQLKRHFWRHGVESYAQQIIEHMAQSRQLLAEQPTLLNMHGGLENLFSHMESSAKDILRRQRHNKQFLSTFKRGS